MAFNFKFHTDAKEQENMLWEEAEKRLTKLGLRYDAITGATVNVRTEAKKNTPHVFRASVVISAKPKNVSAVKKGENPHIALKEALDATERQIKKLLEKIKKPWEEPSDPSRKLKKDFEE